MIDTRVVYKDLPTTIGGCVKETDGFYTIILNSRMTFERNQESYLDEIDHIITGALDQDRPADQIETESHRKVRSGNNR